MTKTRDELIQRALKDLGVLPVGQTASTQEYASVAGLVDPMVADLSARDIYYVEDANAIDDAVFAPLGRYLAYYSAPEFGLQNDPGILSLRPQAEQDLKTIGSEGPTYSPLKVVAW